MTEQKLGNPAVVGLAGFGLTTMLLQFHNVGWMGLGPVIWVGLVFGGLAQMVAGLQEMKTGNNFGYCAFTAYGCFWIALALLLIGNHYDLYVSSKTDIGWFLVAWTAFTAILWVGAMRVNGALGLTFTLLLIGFPARSGPLRLAPAHGRRRLRTDGDRSHGLVHHGPSDFRRFVRPRRAAGGQTVDRQSCRRTAGQAGWRPLNEAPDYNDHSSGEVRMGSSARAR